MLIKQKFEQINKRWTAGREIPTTFIWIELGDKWRDAQNARGRASEREGRVINLVGCRQTKLSVCWFIMNTMRKWNSNGVRIFQLDSKFYCRPFFIRAWNAPTHQHTHTDTHSSHPHCTMEHALRKNCLHSMTMEPSAGLLVFSVLRNSIDATHLLLLLHTTWFECVESQKNGNNNQWTPRLTHIVFS